MVILGILVVLVGLALAVAEAHVPTGVLGVGAGVALAAGGVLVVGGLGAGVWVAALVAAGLALAAAGWLALVARTAGGVRRRRVRSGAEGLCGSLGVVRAWSEPTGRVFVGGALWRARRSWAESESGPALQDGDPVVVEGIDGLTLSVRLAEDWEMVR